MKNKFIILTLFLSLGFYSLEARLDSFLDEKPKDAKILIQNRILAKINEKVISTYDVMKKMDLTFYRQFPQYVSSNEARYQFYQVNWEYILDELINKELVLADAKENKIEVSNGDVRQEMENLFGPNTIVNLDKAGLTFEEAWKIVQGDLIIKRMLGGRVHSKALRLLTPSKVRQAYEAYTQDPANTRHTNWHYQVITIRDRTPQKTETTAKLAYTLLLQGVPLNDLLEKLKENKAMGRKTRVTISEVIKNNEQEMSQTYKDALSSLDAGMYSQPISQKSRTDNAMVYRIFFVKEKIPGGLPSFAEVESKLKDRVLDEIIDNETDQYLVRLRQHFHIRTEDLKAMIPEDYQPFCLQRS